MEERRGILKRLYEWEKGEMSETLTIGILLAMVGGFLDVYSYMARGGVFATAQTGNIVLLGLSIAQSRWLEALYYVFPIAAFALGILVAEAVKAFFLKNRILNWRQIVIGFEGLILFAVAFMPPGMNVLANVSVSFVSSLQIESFRMMNGNPYASTMCTGNFRSAMELLFLYGKGRDRVSLEKSLAYFHVIFFFIVGVVVGAFATRHLAERSVLLACIPQFLVFLLLFLRKGKES